MKRTIYATIAIFVIIMLITLVVAERRPVRTVKYEDGGVVQESPK